MPEKSRALRVAVLDPDSNRLLVNRLHRLGLMVQDLKPDDIRPLDIRTLDEIYLISEAVRRSPQWNRWRVDLSRSARRYVVFCGELASEAIIAATGDGAHDVVAQCESDRRLLDALAGAARSQQAWWNLFGGVSAADSEPIVGRTPGIRALRDSIQRLGPTDATVLLIGESGTGKERVAQSLHDASGRTPFVPVNCAAIPRDLIESELFGVEKGAFTGASASRPGLVQEAEGGTLFLDEIGELDLTLQPKLLRFLETRRARRVGSTREYRCSVRVVAATNQDLEWQIGDGGFRADLYYRLSEIILKVPPLRHRLNDIPDLIRIFLREAGVRFGKHFEDPDPDLVWHLQQHSWPGNVRELKQTIDRLALLYDGPILRAGLWERPQTRLAPEGTPASPSTPPPGPVNGEGPVPGSPAQSPPPRPALPNRRARIELARQLLARDPEQELSWIAAQAGVHPTTLYRWRKAGKV